MVRDKISAEWDTWTINSDDSIPDGFSGLPRLLYLRKDDLDGNKTKIRSVRVELKTVTDIGDIYGIDETNYLNSADITGDSSHSFLTVDRSKYHSPTGNHAYATGEVNLNENHYTLSLSGTNYDTDSWSSPRSLLTLSLGVVARPMGVSRTIWGSLDITNAIDSDTGILELYHDDTWPCITLNPVNGGYEDNGNGHRDAWVDNRDVYLAFETKTGDPGPGWDTNDDGDNEKWDATLQQYVRDPGDIAPIIIFKKVDP
jgi:hypothetical protein